MKKRFETSLVFRITNFFRNEQGFLVVNRGTTPKAAPKTKRTGSIASPEQVRWHITSNTAAYSMPVAAFNSQLG